MRLNISLVLASLLVAVHGHGVITEVAGANGKTGAAFGVIADTPRDGSRARPFQQDSSIIRDREIARGKASPCGRTKAGGVNDIEGNLAAAVSDGLPTAGENGQVSMTLHQVNGDGAGPYTCEVSTDATGNDFQAMTVVTQVPGVRSRSRAKAEDFPLVAQMPAGVACTGGPNGDACIVRCRNSAAAGPFGGCVAVTTADSGNANANATVAATEAAATDAAAETAASASATAAESASATAATKASAETAGANDISDADIAAAEAEEAEEDQDEEVGAPAPKKNTQAAAKGGQKGGLAALLRGKLGGNNQKRMLKSRIAARDHVGRWISA
ncbi:hypothetical protein AURDEDRAFT_111958 [Auricularia subglabra TFB-10046 SS5]|nr:hypothetical protein AURDEDRAFT_111958 [Auricularia subglabra TFB-10046 SS5]